MSEKRLSVSYRRAFHGQDTFFAGSMDQDPHGKSIFFLSGSSCIPEDAFLSGDFGREKCWDPEYARYSQIPSPTPVLRHSRSLYPSTDAGGLLASAMPR